MNPFRRRTLTPDFIAAWQRYEAASKAAAEQYRALPISYNHAGPAHDCLTCGGKTKARDGLCRGCRRAL